MFVALRSRAALAAALFTLVACGQETPLPTTLEPVEMITDVDLSEAAFETEPTLALADLGVAIDDALVNLGGFASVLPSIVAEGPRASSPARQLDSATEFTSGGPVNAIPLAVLGKTLVWNLATTSYELSNPALPGAPANGVRFILYQIDPTTGFPADPLVERGYVDLTREGTASNPAARLAAYTTGGVKVLEYLATVTLSNNGSAVSYRVEGVAGTGPNAATFTLTVGLNLFSGTPSATWRTVIAARALSSRVTVNVGANTYSLTGVLQRGLRKVEIGGTINLTTGGQLAVKVGNKTFARIALNSAGEVTVTNPDGLPLTPEEEETLERIFRWFESALGWYNTVLNPVYTVMDVPPN
ncbi:MAG: hypothetical protein KF689_09500 [Gemmatimonadaceae bacterium]|nr:hypothetical protein [Gemmatimonadaceae bacterium]MCW5826167.1 hypothetical protein [Gemmatimonadaceae bacterium]